MDRKHLAKASLESFSKLAEESEAKGSWNALHALVDDEFLGDLLRNLVALDPAERLLELGNLEIQQETLGAGFYGMLPPQIGEELPLPHDERAFFDAALALAKIRSANLEAVTGAFAAYPLKFSGKTFPSSGREGVPGDWSLELDVASFGALLDALSNPSLSMEDARTVAKQPAFVQMMAHRRGLGYVPEPLIDEEGFAWCIQHAASDDPIDAIWRWLHPHNFFDLSDVRAHSADYRRLLEALDGPECELAHVILSRMAPYVPDGVVFNDSLRFAVGWAINGWATNESGGINLEHFKDDVDRLLDTLTHETFHRLQLKLCPADPAGEPGEFETITHYPLGAPDQETLYRALSYIALEGSATYVGKGAQHDARNEDVETALELLEGVRTATGSDAIDDLLSKGLKSNGPFYGFGALLAGAIVQSAGTEALGAALQAGGPTFVLQGIEAATVEVHGVLLEAIREVASSLERVLRS